MKRRVSQTESARLMRRAVAYERLAAKEERKRNGLGTRADWYRRLAEKLRGQAQRAKEAGR